MFTVIVILMLIMSILLILAVLIQPGKGELSAGLGGVSGQFGSMFGMRRASDFLVKFTIGLALGILLLSLIANKFFLATTAEERTPVTVGAPAPAAVPQGMPAPQQNAPAPQQTPAPVQQAPQQGR